MSILKFANAYQKLYTTTKHMGKSLYDQAQLFHI